MSFNLLWPIKNMLERTPLNLLSLVVNLPRNNLYMPPPVDRMLRRCPKFQFAFMNLGDPSHHPKSPNYKWPTKAQIPSLYDLEVLQIPFP